MASFDERIEILIQGQDNFSAAVGDIGKNVDALSQRMDQFNKRTTEHTAAQAAARQAATAHAEALKAQIDPINRGTDAIHKFGAALGLHVGNVNQFTAGITSLTGGMSPMAAAVTGGVAAIVGLGAAAVKTAVDIEHSQTVIKAYLEAAGASGGLQQTTDGLEALRVKGRLVGVDLAELGNSFTRAFEHADDVGKALEATNLAMNVSIVTGQSYHQILGRMDAAMEGNVRSLRLMGVHMDAVEQAWFKSLDPAERYAVVVDRMKEKFPDLTAAMDTHKTGLAALAVEMEKFENNAGKALLSWADQLAVKLINVANTLGLVATGINNMPSVPTPGGGVNPAAALALGPLALLSAGPMALANLAGGVAGGIGRQLDGTNAARAREFADEWERANGTGNVASGIVDFGEGQGFKPGRGEGGNFRTETTVADANNASAYAQAGALALAKANKAALAQQTKDQEQFYHDQERLQLASLETQNRADRAALDERNRAQEAAFQQERQGEETRHTLAVADIADRERREIAAHEARNAREEVAYRADVKRINDKRDADIASLHEREAANLKQIEGQSRAEQTKYDNAKIALANETRDRNQAFDGEKRAQEQIASSYTQMRERQKERAVDAFRFSLAAAEDTYKKEKALSDQTVRDAETAHKTRVRQIESETATLLANIDNRKRAMDDADRDRSYAEKSEDAAYSEQLAEKKLKKLQAEGADPEQIAAAQRAIFEARRKIGDEYYANEGAKLKESLDAEERGIKETSSAEKQKADDALALVRSTEEEKQRQQQATYDQAKISLEAQIHDEERAAANAIAGAQQVAQIKITSINEAKTAFDNDQIKRGQDLDAAHTDFVRKQADALAATKAIYTAWEKGVKDTAKIDIDERKTAYDAFVARSKDELDNPDYGIKARYLAERTEEGATHQQFDQNLQKRITTWNTQIAKEREELATRYSEERTQIQATYGDQPGGLVRLLKDAKEGYDKLAESITNDINAEEKKSSPEALARNQARIDQLNAELQARRELLGLEQTPVPLPKYPGIAPGAVGTGDEPPMESASGNTEKRYIDPRQAGYGEGISTLNPLRGIKLTDPGLMPSGNAWGPQSRDDWSQGGQKMIAAAVAASVTLLTAQDASLGLNKVQQQDPRFQGVIDSYNKNQQELAAANERLATETDARDRKLTQNTIDAANANMARELADLAKLRASVDKGVESLDGFQSMFSHLDELLPGGKGGNAGSFNPLKQGQDINTLFGEGSKVEYSADDLTKIQAAQTTVGSTKTGVAAANALILDRTRSGYYKDHAEHVAIDQARLQTAQAQYDIAQQKLKELQDNLAASYAKKQSSSGLSDEQIWDMGASFGLRYPHNPGDPVPPEYRAAVKQAYSLYMATGGRNPISKAESPFDQDPALKGGYSRGSITSQQAALNITAGGSAVSNMGAFGVASTVAGAPASSGMAGGAYSSVVGYDDGGLFSRPAVIAVAEKNNREMVGKLSDVMPMMEQSLGRALDQRGGSGGGTYTFHVQTPLDAQRVAREISTIIGRRANAGRTGGPAGYPLR